MTTYTVLDNDGFPITEGLQAHNAERIAQEIANDREESVSLVAVVEGEIDESTEIEFSPREDAE